MSILDQYNNPDHQQGNDLEHQVIDTLEWFGFFAFTAWVIHRIVHRGHYASGAILIISSVAAFVVLMKADMASDAAYVFWTLAAVAFVSLGKAIS